MRGIKLSTKEFVAKARSVHGRRYSYNKSVYVNDKTAVSIKCREHGLFRQLPSGHTRGQNCPKCARETDGRYTTLEFTDKAQSVHGNRYDYSKTEYVNRYTEVTIKCRTHGLFTQNPYNHLSGRGCQKCALGAQRSSVDEFVAKAKRVHGRKYDYSLVDYKSVHEKITIICKEHGPFKHTASGHLAGRQGCAQCRTNGGYSRLGIKAVEDYARSRRLKNVQHAHNGGEYTIPGTKLRADGFHAATNTVIEFMGDRFHGNPKVYDANERCSVFARNSHGRPCKAGTLYKRTMKRIERLQRLGYNVAVIWEHDFKHIQKTGHSVLSITKLYESRL